MEALVETQGPLRSVFLRLTVSVGFPNKAR
jgi:hypothetical protein